MSRLRADQVVNKNANGPFEATEGIKLSANRSLVVESGSTIADTNLNELIKFPAPVASAVNEITVTNAATGGTPSLSATGDDTNISLNLISKGSGTVKINNVDIVGTTSIQTLTNKTLTSPVLVTPVFSGVTYVTASGAQTLFNKTLDTPTLFNPSFTGMSDPVVTVSGFQTLANKTLATPSFTGTVPSLSVSALSASSLSVTGASNLTQITETVVNAFNTVLAPSSGTLTIDTNAGTVLLGDLNASVTTWAFTNVPTTNSRAITITLIIDGDTAQTYGDACSVNGVSITNGVKWVGGTAPTATNNFDFITFAIVRDSAGTINVFGSAGMNYS